MATIEKGVALWSGICGVVLLLCGIGSVVCGGIFSQYVGSLGGLYAIGMGFWSGAALIISGALGIAAWPTKNQGVLIGFLSLSIITIILCAIQCAIAGIVVTLFNLVLDVIRCTITFSRCRCSNGGQVVTYNADFCSHINLIYGVWMAVTVFSGIGAFLSLAGSIISCIGLCGARPQQPGAVIVQQPSQQTFVIDYSQQQYPQQYPHGMQPYPLEMQQFPPGAGQAPPAYSDGTQYQAK